MLKFFCNGAPKSVRNNIVEKMIGICSSQLAYSVVYVEILNRKKKTFILFNLQNCANFVSNRLHVPRDI